MTETNSLKRKILFLDIENIARPENIFRTSGKYQRPAGFSSDLAYIIVFGYKWLHEKEAKYIIRDKKSFKADPIGDDEIVKQIYDLISEADIVCTYYGSGHDMPFTTARLARHGLYLDRRIKHIDLWRIAKSSFSMSSNRLDNVAEFMGSERKDKISFALWPATWFGDYDALTEIAEYCKQDVVALEDLYHKMLPFITNHPVMYEPKQKDRAGCPQCGLSLTVKQGFWSAGKKTFQKHMCKNCGTYFKGAFIPPA